ncbi:ESC/E(Z) complex protein, partial [Zymoseptoria tritici IPO323]
MRFHCPYHGELVEHSPSDDELPEEDEAIVQTDIIHPPRINHRSRVTFPPSVDEGDPNVPIKDRRAASTWLATTASLNTTPETRGPFYPCHHPGESCVSAKCSCWRAKITCEKICSCAPSCPRKFQGCSCSNDRARANGGTSKKNQKYVCFEDARCACFQSGRECDPDLCGECGVCDILDPVHRHDDRILQARCRNASIQRGVPKHTILGDSGVHGLGLYACEDIRAHEYVGEYKGEIITKEEADRRGSVYEHQKLSYLFSLNQKQEIDSTYFGTKIRFINHAGDGKGNNLYPRIIMVNTVYRIALYASRNIRAGEELFFDYGPMFPDEQ